jgi:arylsulfatase A-like enzyme
LAKARVAPEFSQSLNLENTVTKRPNFILFITDQHHADFLGCNGHPVVRTPNIDAIASRGVNFDRFYVSSPVCMPNRASLMTGRMPSVHGVRSNGIPLSVDAVTFVDLLRDAGYATGLIGKSHLQNFTGRAPLNPPTEPPEGFRAPSSGHAQALRRDNKAPVYDQESPTFWSDPSRRIEEPFYGFEHVELVTGHGDGVGGDYARWLAERHPDPASLIGADNQLPHDYACPQAVRTAVPEELYSSHYIGERAAAFIAEHESEEKPFFLMVSFPDPHHPFNPPGRYWDMYNPDDFPAPEAFRRQDWIAPPHVASVFEERDSGTANMKGMFTLAVTEREAREAQALTAGMVTCLDDAIGQVMAGLGAMGLSEETVVCFTADHGDHLGNHRLLLKGAEQYQDILRVPFIWSDPMFTEDARRTSSLGSTKDIAATILERARLAPYVGLQGKSLLAVTDGRHASVQDDILVQYDHQRINAGLGLAPRVHSLIDARWRISVFKGVDWGELYDLENDPGEFVNLWDDPSSAAEKARLLERLLRAELDHIDEVPTPTAQA